MPLERGKEEESEVKVEYEDEEEEKQAVTVVVVNEEEESDSAGGIDPGLHEEKVEDSIWATRGSGGFSRTTRRCRTDTNMRTPLTPKQKQPYSCGTPGGGRRGHRETVALAAVACQTAGTHGIVEGALRRLHQRVGAISARWHHPPCPA